MAIDDLDGSYQDNPLALTATVYLLLMLHQGCMMIMNDDGVYFVNDLEL